MRKRTVSKKQTSSKKHYFFKDRSITEGYIVSRIDDFYTTPDSNGGFHTAMYLGKGGLLRPSAEKAIAAATYVLNKKEVAPGTLFGVCKIVAIVQAADRPVKVVKV